MEHRNASNSLLCTICGFTCNKEAELIKHELVHFTGNQGQAGNALYSCSICFKSFSKKERLLRHSRKHAATHLYSCRICKHLFLTKDEVAKHEQNKHFRYRPFSCRVCGKGYFFKHNLERHELIHDSNHPSSHKVSNASIIRNSILEEHGLTKRVDMKDNPFSCPVCHKSFRQAYSVTQHMRLHSGNRMIRQPFLCTHCNKGYTHKSSLFAHIISMHSQEN